MITKNTLGPHTCPSCGNQCDAFKDLDDWDYCNDCRPDNCPSCGSYRGRNLKKDLDGMDYCNDCRPVTAASKLAETLDQFRNGAERYDNDPIFKQAIDSLVAGVGVYAVLDSLLRRLSHQQEVNAHNLELLKTASKLGKL